MALAKDLTRDKILLAALDLLRTGGLAGLSMRRLASTLDVAPAAVYWHVPSKQELLALLADAILIDADVRDSAEPASTQSPTTAEGRARWISEHIGAQSLRIRAALLSVRDGAEVISFARALKPEASMVTGQLHTSLRDALSEPAAELAARALTAYILGQVAEEQNHAELIRAGLLTHDGAIYSAEVFLFGVQAIVDGVLGGGGRS